MSVIYLKTGPTFEELLKYHAFFSFTAWDNTNICTFHRRLDYIKIKEPG